MASIPLVTQIAIELPHIRWRAPVGSDYAGLENDIRVALDGDLLVGTFSRLGVRNLGPAHAYWHAPWYALTGEGAGGMVLAAWVAHLVAVAAVLAVVRSVVGWRAAWVAATVLALAWLRAGPAALSDFYNPAMTVPAVMVATASCAAVAVGQWRFLALAVAAVSMGAQVHFAAASGLFLVAGAGSVLGLGVGHPRRQDLARAAVVACLLWAPTLVDQAMGNHNLSLLGAAVAAGPETPDQFFGLPSESASRVERARVAAEVVTLTGSEPSVYGTLYGTASVRRLPTSARSATAAAVLAAALALAWCHRRRAVFGSVALALAGLGAATTYLQTAALSRGFVNYYLAPLLGYGIVAWVGAALIVAARVRSRLPDPRPAGVPPALAGLAGLAALGAAGLAVGAPAVTTLIDGGVNPVSSELLVSQVMSVVPPECVDEGVAIEAPAVRMGDVWTLVVAFDKLGVHSTVPEAMEQHVGSGHRRTGHEAATVTLPPAGWPGHPEMPAGGPVRLGCDDRS